MLLFNKNIIFRNNKFMIIKTTVKKLCKKYNVQSWDKTVYPDIIKIKNIKKFYISENIKIIDGIIYGWTSSDSNKLFIYDGIHRLLASSPELLVICKIYNESEFKKIEPYTSISFYIEEDINSNISTKRSASNISIDSLASINIDVILNDIMNKMCNKFINSISYYKNPRKFNFNRDTFVENILSKLNFDLFKNQDIFSIILEINEYAKEYIILNKIEVNIKCYIYDFYLMYLDDNTIINMINEKLNE